MSDQPKASFETLLIHGGSPNAGEASKEAAVSPSISTSTTFELPPELESFGKEEHCYSRVSSPTRDQLEVVLGKLEGQDARALTYSSGLAAANAAMMYFKPRRVAINMAYHGIHQVIQSFKRLGVVEEVVPLNASFNYTKGDLLWIETPLNPTGEITNIKLFADLAHKAGAHVIVDSTFAPPPLQQCLSHGADLVLHAATKYLGGHSDILMGVLAMKNEPTLKGTTGDDRSMYSQLKEMRIVLGSVPGSLESWLLLRSLKTLSVRVKRQVATAQYIAKNLDEVYKKEVDAIVKVYHPSLSIKAEDEEWILEQMPNGFGGTLALVLDSKERAVEFIGKLKYWKNATSLGGVESLIDHRYRWDKTADPGLLRLSCGLESEQDLLFDLVKALGA